MRLLDDTYRVIDELNRRVGTTVAWLTLGMVLVQFTVVVARYVFAKGSIPAQESIWYMHGMVFMVGAGYTLLRDGHVRVDVFYRESRLSTKAIIDLIGVFLFLIPVCVYTFDIAWDYVINSWAVKEKSTETNGIPAIYLLKTIIWAAIALLALQGVSMAARSARQLVTERPPLAGWFIVGLLAVATVAINRAFYEAGVESQIIVTAAALVAVVGQAALTMRGSRGLAFAQAAILALAGAVVFYYSGDVAEWADLVAKVVGCWLWILVVIAPGVALAAAAGGADPTMKPVAELPDELNEPHPPAFVGRDLIIGLGVVLLLVEVFTWMMLSWYMADWLMPVRGLILAVLYLGTLMRFNGARLALVAALFIAGGETLHYAAIASGDVGAVGAVVLAYGNIIAAMMLMSAPSIAKYTIGQATDFEAVITEPLRTISAVFVAALLMTLAVVELELFAGVDGGLLPAPFRTFVVFALPVGILVGSRLVSWLAVAVLAAGAALIAAAGLAPGEDTLPPSWLAGAVVALLIAIAGAWRSAGHSVHTPPRDLPAVGGPDLLAHLPALAVIVVVTGFLCALSITEFILVPASVTGLVTPIFLTFLGTGLMFGVYQGRYLPTWLLQAIMLVGAYLGYSLATELSAAELSTEMRFYLNQIFPPAEGVDPETRPAPAAAVTWIWVATVGLLLSTLALLLPAVRRFQAAQREARRQAEGTTA